jgi:hypothetical protein
MRDSAQLHTPVALFWKKNHGNPLHKAVPWFKWLVISLTPYRHESVHVGLVVEKVAMIQVSSTNSLVFPISIIQLKFHANVSSRG